VWSDLAVALTPAWPALGAIAIAALLGLGWKPTERAIVRLATTTLVLSLLSVLVGVSRWVGAFFGPVDVRVGHWYRAGESSYELVFLIDRLSAPVSLTAAVLLLATCRFSANYLHREQGFVRFFTLVLVFAAGIQLLLLGGSIELMFAGWELVGMCSVLLVAFFQERTGPVRAAIRLLVTYRLCDTGLVLGALLLHHEHHSTVFATVLANPARTGDVLVALGFLLAAMGKSAQFPVGGWLPRAMEGPTASSAVFYGGLSVHAGVYLMARMEPLYAASPVLRLLVVGVGLVTALAGSLSAQVSPDAKSSLAYATITQVGIMFVECGLGFPSLAILHLVAHATLRYYQFLRTPSVLQDALKRRAALGATHADESAARWEMLGLPLRRFLYRLAIERFEAEAALERWIARPALSFSSRLDAWERSLFSPPAGGPAPAAPRSVEPPPPVVEEGGPTP
jgi:NADH-quinone oxidoreductase subunit L